jgi:hypothetical protein
MASRLLLVYKIFPRLFAPVGGRRNCETYRFSFDLDVFMTRIHLRDTTSKSNLWAPDANLVGSFP